MDFGVYNIYGNSIYDKNSIKSGSGWKELTSCFENLYGNPKEPKLI